MYLAWYRKWRPKTLGEVVGQGPITSILGYECAHRQFSHAYLFCGSRGTGKTSCAKILAKAVNCERPTASGDPCGTCDACRSIEAGSATDVLEMDAASNNSVENIRDIRDEVIYAPSALKYRVYIIDEAHMLSGSAFNALLKTLEEPPPHVIFILATTELQKLPATIVSRCQRFDFRRIPTPDLTARLRQIAEGEGAELTDDGARLIARRAQGGMRDAISLLELCAGERQPIDAALVARVVGAVGREETGRVVRAIAERDYDALFRIIEEAVSSSKDLSVFWQELIGCYRDMLVAATAGHPARFLDLTDEERASIEELSRLFTRETMLRHIELLQEAFLSMQKAYAVRQTVAETTLLRLCDPSSDPSLGSVLSRLSRLEERLDAGAPAAPAAPTGACPAGRADRPPPDPSSPAAAPTVPEEPHRTRTPARPSPAPAPKGRRSSGQGELRPFPQWEEVTAGVRRTHPAAAPFLMRATAYRTGDGKAVIRFAGAFERGMVAGKPEAAEALRAALSAALGRELRAADVILELEPESREASPLDLIVEAARDDGAPQRETQGKETAQ